MFAVSNSWRYGLRFVSECTIVKDLSGGKLLIRAMKEQGYSNKSLAEEAGLSTKTITNLRNGHSAGNMATWRKIARVLHMDMNDLTSTVGGVE